MSEPWTVTMAEIYRRNPCKDGWAKLREHTGLPATDDSTPVSLLTIIDSNGFDDALWCLRAVKGRDREIRLYAVWCGRQVQHLMTDPHSLAALDVAERYANGQASVEELDAAWAAARDAAWDAAWAAAWDAARAAAWDAAWAAARAAAWDAAGDAAGDAAWDAAWAAAKDAQEARFRAMVSGEAV